MCEFFGYVGARCDAGALVLAGLQSSASPGHEAWGIAVCDDGHVIVDRRVGSIAEATTGLPFSGAALSYMRVVKRGQPPRDSAQPQLDCGARLAVVHDGILANEDELRQALARAGHRVRSATSTELIAHLLEDLLQRTPQGPERLLRATVAALRKLRGLRALAVLDSRRGELVAANNGEALYVGATEAGYLLTSHQAGLLEHTRQVAWLREGQVALLQHNRARFFEADSGVEVAPDFGHNGKPAGPDHALHCMRDVTDAGQHPSEQTV